MAAPELLGRLLVACHGNSWAWWAEHERELQALAVVRRIEELVAGDPAHVIVGGDFNATPETSSMRFWTGRKSLDGTSTAYRDCWESVHGSEPGLTFEPQNPLSAIDEPDLDRGRRIDYVLVRCSDHGPACVLPIAGGSWTNPWTVSWRAITTAWSPTSSCTVGVLALGVDRVGGDDGVVQLQSIR